MNSVIFEQIIFTLKEIIRNIPNGCFFVKMVFVLFL